MVKINNYHYSDEIDVENLKWPLSMAPLQNKLQNCLTQEFVWSNLTTSFILSINMKKNLVVDKLTTFHIVGMTMPCPFSLLSPFFAIIHSAKSDHILRSLCPHSSWWSKLSIFCGFFVLIICHLCILDWIWIIVLKSLPVMFDDFFIAKKLIEGRTYILAI